jgi:hypothetical protein
MHDPYKQSTDDLERPDRREFTLLSILALLSGVTITISGCNGDGGASPTSPGGPSTGASGSVTANHGHVARIESAQLMANNAVTLNIRGSATHPHSVTLSSQEISQVAASQRVSAISSTEDSPDAGRHSHVVTFN